MFAPEIISIIQEALKRLEEPLERANQDQGMTVAIEEVRRVKAKLETMKAEAEHMYSTPFNYSESVMLVAAIQMYTFDLNMLPASPRRAWELDQCERIATYFAPKQPDESAKDMSIQ